MGKSQTRNILAMVTIDKELIIEAGIPTFLAKDEKMQEKISSEIARTLGGNVYGLANGVIIITEE